MIKAKRTGRRRDMSDGKFTDGANAINTAAAREIRESRKTAAGRKLVPSG